MSRPVASPPPAPTPFEKAAASALALLQSQVGLELWLVTRREGDAARVVATRGAGLPPGTLLPWEDTICAPMARGEGPRCAPRCGHVPAYAETPLRRRLTVGAYLGAPLVDDLGEVVGSICGVAALEQPQTLARALPLVEQTARLLDVVLAQESEVDRWQAATEAAELRAERDPVTGLLNRRGWERALAVEEDRSDRSGLPAGIVVVDLDRFKQVNDLLGHLAGDTHLRGVGRVLTAGCRPQDAVARVGGDEFAVLLAGCDGDEVTVLRRRLEQHLALAGVRASVGASARRAAEPLPATWERADAAMYAAKRGLPTAPLALPSTTPPGPRLVPDLPPDALDTAPAPGLDAVHSGSPSPSARSSTAVEGLAARRILLLALHLAGGLEPIELAALDLADVSDHPSGLFVAVRSAAGGSTAPRHLAFACQRDDSCPVCAYRRWRDLLEQGFRHRRGYRMEPEDRGDQPLFCAVGRDGLPGQTPLSEHGLARLLRAATGTAAGSVGHLPVVLRLLGEERQA